MRLLTSLRKKSGHEIPVGYRATRLWSECSTEPNRLSGILPKRLLERYVFSNTDPVRYSRILFSLLGQMRRNSRIGSPEMDPRLNHTIHHDTPLHNFKRYAK